MTLTSNALAKEPINRFGVQADVGVPDGIGVGFNFRPHEAFRLNISATHNLAALGMRAGLTLDPIDFPIAPTITLEAGGNWRGPIPYKDMPDVSTTYANFHLGIDMGNHNNWRFFIHAGPSFLSVNTYEINRLIKNTDPSLSIDNPRATAWLAPTAKIGFTVYF